MDGLDINQVVVIKDKDYLDGDSSQFVYQGSKEGLNRYWLWGLEHTQRPLPEGNFQPFDLVQGGDVLIMVTDGVTEAMNFDGSPYGRDRLIASIRKHQSLDAQQLAQQILWDVRRFAGLAEQSDDITVVVAKVR